MPFGACATRWSASSSATCVVKKLVCAYSSLFSSDRRSHSRMRMAEAGHGGAAGRVDVVLAVHIADENSSPARCDRIVVTDLPMKDVRHDRPEPLRRGRT